MKSSNLRRWRKALVTAVVLTSVVSGSVIAGSTGSAQAATCSNVAAAQVKVAQQKLSASGFWHSGADGRWGPSTQQAVYAFQKYRGVATSGCADAVTVRAISAFAGRPAMPSGAPTTGAAIDQTRQLLYFTSGNKVKWVFNTSTGNQIPWRKGKYSGKAITPNGTHRVDRAIDGNRSSSLGLGNMYRPRYFAAGGIAVHGSGFIPTYADSHGCARVSNAAMDFIWANKLLPIGGKVVVFGKPRR